MELAIFHPYLKSRGGAERVVYHIVRQARGFGVQPTVFTLFHDPQNTFPFEEHAPVRVLAPNSISAKCARKYYTRGAYFTLLAAAAKADLRGYDAVLTSVSGIGITFARHNHIGGRTFAYVHTPLRAAGTPEDIAFHTAGQRRIKRIFHTISAEAYRAIVRPSWHRHDGLIYNSPKTRQRVRWLGYWRDGQREQILPPPADEWALITKWHGEHGDYVLYFSRFAHSKRQLEVVEAWRRSGVWFNGMRLVLAGQPSNPYYAKAVLNRIASYPPEVRRSIDVVFNAPDEEIAKLHARAAAVLFAGYAEEYGIAALDSVLIGAPTFLPSSAGVLCDVAWAPNVHVYPDYFEPTTFISELTGVFKMMWLKLRNYTTNGGRKGAHDVLARTRSPSIFAGILFDTIRRWSE